MDVFDTMWRRAYLDQLRALLPGRCAEDLDLLPLDDTLAALGSDGEVDLGTQEVPLDAIVGSVRRAEDFDRQFRPRSRHLRERWEHLARVERGLPPVDLLQLNDFYFVGDGHHRVSLARARGMARIPAHVRRIRTVVCANRCLTLTDLPRKRAERAFLERVPLPDDVRVGLELDQPGEWRRLAEAAEAWGFRHQLAGEPAGDRCGLADAWWAEEVLPTVEALHGRGIGVERSVLETYLHELDDHRVR